MKFDLLPVLNFFPIRVLCLLYRHAQLLRDESDYFSQKLQMQTEISKDINGSKHFGEKNLSFSSLLNMGAKIVQIWSTCALVRFNRVILAWPGFGNPKNGPNVFYLMKKHAAKVFASANWTVFLPELKRTDPNVWTIRWWCSDRHRISLNTVPWIVYIVAPLAHGELGPNVIMVAQAKEWGRAHQRSYS